jgi:hypothetical protein
VKFATGTRARCLATSTRERNFFPEGSTKTLYLCPAFLPEARV